MYTSGFQVIFEDNHLLVVNKAAGMLVQGDETGDTPLVEHGKVYIKEKFQKPGAVFLGVVHRLDRPVSGVVVFARTSKALERMNALFRERSTEKIYWALVNSKPPADSGTLIHWLKKDEKKNKTTWFTRETPNALRSELSYQLLAFKNGYYLLEVKPITGRSHQIRAQLASMNCPIVGDVKYGAPELSADGRIYLHARKLSFLHPVKKEPVTFVADLPHEKVWQIFSTLDTKA